MGQFYVVDSSLLYREEPDFQELEKFLKENTEGYELEPTRLACWGEASYSFTYDLLEMIDKTGDLVEAEVDVADEETNTRYTWSPNSNSWEPTVGKVCYNADEAEKQFGESSAHKALKQAFAAYVMNDVDGTGGNAEYCYEMLMDAGCTEEMIKDLGLEWIIDTVKEEA